MKSPADSNASRSAIHSREPSLTSKNSTGLAISTPAEARQGGTQSPRFLTTRSRAGSGADSTGDPKSTGYGHHRQTSIVHGMQHSRNSSAASNTSNPLSPQMIAAAGGANVIGNMAHNGEDPSSLQHLGIAGNLAHTGLVMTADRNDNIAENGANIFNQRRVERRQSGRAPRQHNHHRSQSRHHHKEEPKTVGEYALHVLFTSVSPAVSCI